MKQLSCIIFIIVSALVLPAWADNYDDHAILVTASKPTIERFTSKELRLLYLGYPVTRDGQSYKPLINLSNKTLYQKFLQKVMFMTEDNYERQLVTRVFRHGGQTPGKYSSREILLEVLKSTNNSVTFITPDTIKPSDQIYEIQRLW